MWYPNWRQEKKLFKRGFHLIAGVDEVGRGAWAGPLVAAAVILDPQVKIKGIKDSKLLLAPSRKNLCQQIIDSAWSWALGVVEQETIDQIGLGLANQLALAKAASALKIKPDYLLVDGLKFFSALAPSLSIVDGDYKVTSIAAASIVAKVKRDEIMEKLAEVYPAYGFNQHKGYGTSYHYQMLIEHGVSAIHRKTFAPIRLFLAEDEE